MQQQQGESSAAQIVIEAGRVPLDLLEYFEPIPANRMSDVFVIPSQPFPGAHFATFPRKLAERCILAGTSQRGCCPACGKPWERVVERDSFGKAFSATKYGDDTQAGPLSRSRQAYRANGMEGPPPAKTLGWRPTCSCPAHEPVPCTVLDPFAGAGTTGVVAEAHRRRFIGVELNREYAAMAKKRIERPHADLRPAREKAMPLFGGEG